MTLAHNTQTQTHSLSHVQSRCRTLTLSLLIFDPSSKTQVAKRTRPSPHLTPAARLSSGSKPPPAPRPSTSAPPPTLPPRAPSPPASTRCRSRNPPSNASPRPEPALATIASNSPASSPASRGLYSAASPSTRRSTTTTQVHGVLVPFLVQQRYVEDDEGFARFVRVVQEFPPRRRRAGGPPPPAPMAAACRVPGRTCRARAWRCCRRGRRRGTARRRVRRRRRPGSRAREPTASESSTAREPVSMDDTALLPIPIEPSNRGAAVRPFWGIRPSLSTPARGVRRCARVRGRAWTRAGTRDSSDSLSGASHVLVSCERGRRRLRSDARRSS